MTAYLYTWDPGERKWLFRGLLPTENAAREKGRLLWAAGAHGVKIDVIQTVVEEKRTQ